MMSEIPGAFPDIQNKNAYLLRIGAIAELDAINLYTQLSEHATDEFVRDLFKEVAKEEKIHLAEFISALREYDVLFDTYIPIGESEVCHIASRHGMSFAFCKPPEQK